MMSDGSKPGLVGARVQRVEDDRYLNGRGRYIDDITPPGTLHLRLVRSTMAHARIEGVDIGEFEPLPEDALVFVGDDVDLEIAAPIDAPGAQQATQPVLARGVARFVGEPVAAVLHPDPYVVEDAADVVVPNLTPLEPTVDVLEALQPQAEHLHDGWDRNAFIRRTQSFGDIDQARVDADHVVRRVTRTGRQAGVPLENRGCVAVPDMRDGLTLWSSTQIPHMLRTYVAGQLEMPEHNLRVAAPDVGGGFGVKGHVFAEEVLCAWLAQHTGRPVKWIEDRQEHLLASIHARDHLHLIEAHVRGDGRITGLRAQIVVDVGAYSVYPWTAGSDPGMVGKVLTGVYDIQNLEIEDIAVATNKCPLGTYRGVGRPSAVFTMERLMDGIARDLDLDPVAVRRANIIRDFPHRTAGGVEYDPGSYLESLDKACAAVGYDEPDVASRRSGAHGALGIGFAVYNEQSAHGALDFELRGVPIESGYESVSIVMEPDGQVTLSTGLQSHGQGLETTLAQVVAGELGVALERVRVQHGATDQSPYGMGTWGSRGAVLGGGAASRAAVRIRQKLLSIAAHHLEVDEDDLEILDGQVAVKGARSKSIEVSRLAYMATRRAALLPPGMDPGLHATVSHDGPPRGTFSNSCHAAVVEVDRLTGRVRIQRYIVVEDCGTVINPMIVDGQVLGGVAQGIGSALLEEFSYSDDGQPISSTFMDYLMPTSTDVPNVEIHHLETKAPGTIYGMKGMGEAGAIGPMAAIANAVSDALDCEMDRTPLRMARVWDTARVATTSAQEFDQLSTHPALASFWST